MRKLYFCQSVTSHLLQAVISLGDFCINNGGFIFKIIAIQFVLFDMSIFYLG